MIDSHCHINDELYKNNPSGYVKEAQEFGVSKFLVVGSNLNDSILASNIAGKIDCCYAAVGIHPSDVKNAGSDDYLEIESLAKQNKIIAIGEIGLDYYWDKESNLQEEQKIAFIKQIEIANKYNLPIIVHNRDAIEDCLKILKEHPVNNKGIIHCFSGSVEVAREFIKLGYILGFGGVCTFKNAVKIKEVIKEVPLGTFVLETDSPYLAPTPYRGQPNHSKYLKIILQEVANLKNLSQDVIEKTTDETFKKVFKL